MPTLADCKFSALTDQGYTGTINDMEWAWLSDQTGLTVGTMGDQWYALLTGLGYTGTVSDMQVASWIDQGWVAGTWNDLAKQFWCTGGGTYGPSVSIISDDAPVFCEFQPPVTDDCTAAGDYTANDTGFTNPADTWLWTIEPPVVGVNLTNATAKTCTVTTPTSATDLTFNLKVVATDSVSTDTADRTTTFTQQHIDSNVAPVYIGPAIGDRTYTVDVPITTVETFNLYTGTNLAFSLEPPANWPTGLVIDAGPNTANVGDVTGTPTGALGPYPGLFIEVVNSKGVADSSPPFTITLISGAGVAPIFDNGPVPDQNWPIDQAIAQFPMGQYFITGTFPRTYTIESGALPTGLTMNTAGQINGTPSIEGETGSVVVRCTNAAGFDVTNNWSWVTWEAIVKSTVPAQTATVGVEYTHDFSQYFTGTISGYGINTGSWPPETVFDTNTGIATFTPTTTFSSNASRVFAESDYEPAAVSNSFLWTVLDEPISNVVITEDQAGSCSYDPGPVLTAVHLGTPGTSTVANYYTSTEGLINADYTAMTHVFSFYGVSPYGGVGTAKNVFSSTNSDGLVDGYDSQFGGWRTSLKRVTNTPVNFGYTVYPGAMALNAWHAVMFTVSAAGAWSLWVDGASVASGNIGAQTFYAHNRIGDCFLGKNQTTATAQECYLSHVWCHNVYYDPAVYWQEFFDAQNYPKDLGADGSTPTGVQPLSYFPNGDPTDNRGTLNNWTEVGTVPQAPTSPSD